MRLEKRENNKTIWMVVGAIVVVVLIAVVTVIVLKNISSNGSEDPSEEETGIIENPTGFLSEEEKDITKQTIDDYVEVSFGGYQHIEDEKGGYNAVVVTLTNKSSEDVCIAVQIAAKDGEGNTLDMSSLYAEGIGPGQTQTFYTFVYSELSPEQLKSANFEIYKAYTYEANVE